MRFALVVAAFAVLSPGVAAYADTISTFNIQGSSLFYGMGGDKNTISGSATIDTTTGVVESISFTAGGLAASGLNAQYGPDVFVGPLGAHFTFTGASLINYTGSTFNLNGNDLYVGQVTLASSPATPSPISITPEPASLLLLSTGLFGIFAMTRRRFA